MMGKIAHRRGGVAKKLKGERLRRWGRGRDAWLRNNVAGDGTDTIHQAVNTSAPARGRVPAKNRCEQSRRRECFYSYLSILGGELVNLMQIEFGWALEISN